MNISRDHPPSKFRAGQRGLIIFQGSGVSATRRCHPYIPACAGSSHARGENPRGAGSGLRVTPQRRLRSPWLRVKFSHPVPPRHGPSRSAGRDAGFQPSVYPQRRGGSRAAQTFVPVIPGRVIGLELSFRSFQTGYHSSLVVATSRGEP